MATIGYTLWQVNKSPFPFSEFLRVTPADAAFGEAADSRGCVTWGGNIAPANQFREITDAPGAQPIPIGSIVQLSDTGWRGARFTVTGQVHVTASPVAGDPPQADGYLITETGLGQSAGAPRTYFAVNITTDLT